MPVIGTNTAANTSLRYLNQNSETQNSQLAKLSSGSRIERASDDAAGLAVSTKIQSDISVLDQAALNAQQGTSVLQTADGALSALGDILQRMQSLTAQSQSGIIDNDDRALINTEFQELVTEYTSIVSGTNFNGAKLLDGSYDQDFLVGSDATTTSSDSINVSLSNVAIASYNSASARDTSGTLSGGVTAVTASSAAAATGSLTFTGQPSVGDTVTLNGIEIEFIANGDTPSGNQVEIGTDAAETAANLATFLNAATDTELTGATYASTGTGANATLTVTFDTTGTGGNAFTIVEDSTNVAASGATLTGGSAAVTGVTGVAATGSLTFTAQPAAGDTVSINGVAFEFVSSGATGNQVNIGADLTTTLANLATTLNASTSTSVSGATYTSDATTLTVTNDTTGAAGNNFTLEVSSASGAVTGADSAIYTLISDSDAATTTVDITTQQGAKRSADIIDRAIDGVATQRASVGALISRFDFRSDVIAVTSENLKAANSSIVDADIAQVQTDYTTAQVLTDASIAALGRANQLPQKLLDLVQ